MEGKEKVERLKKLYPKGTVIRLIKMEDEQAPEPGTLGSVLYVDGIGTIHMRWDNGSGLGLIEGLDQFEVIGK